MQFVYDPERLIEEVKKRPGIWDLESLEYRVAKKRRKLWSEVINELNANTVSATKSEMRELELQLQKKWKSLRDCFIKYVQNPNKRKRPYIYYRDLQFLLKNSSAEVAQRDDSSDTDEGKTRITWLRKKKVSLMTETAETSADDDDVNNQHCVDTNDNNDDEYDVHVPAKASQNKPIQESSFVFANVDSAMPKRESDDPDKLFLLSLLPHLKSVPEEYRLNVKMELMQILQNANYNSGQGHKLL